MRRSEGLVRGGGIRRGAPSSAPYLWRHLLTTGLMVSSRLGLGVVEGRLGLGVSTCG